MWYFSDISNDEHPPSSIKPPKKDDKEINSYFRNDKGLWLYSKKWIPEGNPKAIVFLIHGHSEHINRKGYDDFAQLLVQAGYAVYGMDHQGHGKSNGSRGHIKKFVDYCVDLELFVKIIKSKHTDLPLFAVGHSMGGAVLLKAVLRQPDLFRGIILSAPCLTAHLDPNYSSSLAWAGNLVKPLIPKAMAIKIPLHQLSRNSEACKVYDKDSLRCPYIPISTATELSEIGKDLYENFNNIQIPFLAIHGKEDKVVDSSSSTYLFDKASSKDKKLIVWPSVMHELWEDPEKGDIFAMMINWLNDHL